MEDLFADAAEQRLHDSAPLAARLRPPDLAGFEGQTHIVGPGTALRRAIEAGAVSSFILHGPPGTGKTTLARIVARATDSCFEELSAVACTVRDVREVLGRAQEELGGNGRRSILFLDEIHRFNKAQQDALLPAVETGLIVLIGATTENPYFDVNAALLSRCEVYELEALAPEELFRLIERGAQELCVELDTHVAEAIVERAGGDARTALSTLELATATARHEQAEQPLETAHPNVTVAHVEDAAHKRPLLYDRAGDRHYNFTSALIKSIRGSDPDAAVYYLATMIEAGEDPRFIARRLVVHASEDIGNADPMALTVAVAAANAVELVGLPEARLNLAHATLYLATAAKSNAVVVALERATQDVRSQGAQPPPIELRDSHGRGSRERGHGEGYRYPPDDPHGYEFDHLPEAMRGRRYYEPDS